MYDVFNDPDVMQPAVLLVIIGIIALSAVGMSLFRNYKAEKLVADLKMNMLDRGMSAEEIERVITAKPGGGKQFKTTL